MVGTIATLRVMRRRSQGLSLNVEEAFHDDLAGEGSGDGGVLAGGEQSEGEHGAGAGEAEHAV